MKAIRVFFAVLALTIISATSMTANAQFRFGPKIGLNVSSLHFDKSAFDSENQTGFTGGLMMEFTVPVIGVGFDLSAMYVRRNAQFMQNNEVAKDKRDYIEIPLNLKYKIGLPVVGKIITPYLTTGPSVAFLTSKTGFDGFVKNKTFDAAWNFGFGVQLLNHLQVGASYGLGMTKAFKTVGVGNGSADIDAKNNYWTVTAAYLF